MVEFARSPGRGSTEEPSATSHVATIARELLVHAPERLVELVEQQPRRIEEQERQLSGLTTKAGRKGMKTQLTDVRGIGPSTARALEALGIRSVAALAEASAKKVAGAPGFGEARAAEVIAAAGALLDTTAAPNPAAGEAAAQAMNAAATQLGERKVAANDSAPSEGREQTTVKKVKAKKKKKKLKKEKLKKKTKKKKKKKKN